MYKSALFLFLSFFAEACFAAGERNFFISDARGSKEVLELLNELNCPTDFHVYFLENDYLCCYVHSLDIKTFKITRSIEYCWNLSSIAASNSRDCDKVLSRASTHTVTSFRAHIQAIYDAEAKEFKEAEEEVRAVVSHLERLVGKAEGFNCVLYYQKHNNTWMIERENGIFSFKEVPEIIVQGFRDTGVNWHSSKDSALKFVWDKLVLFRKAKAMPQRARSRSRGRGAPEQAEPVAA